MTGDEGRELARHLVVYKFAQYAPCEAPNNGCESRDGGQQTAVCMNSPLDWDYADIKRRMEALHVPPYKAGSGTAGNHCQHCPKDAAEHCLMSCSQAYRDRYGVEPQ